MRKSGDSKSNSIGFLPSGRASRIGSSSKFKSRVKNTILALAVASSVFFLSPSAVDAKAPQKTVQTIRSRPKVLSSQELKQAADSIFRHICMAYPQAKDKWSLSRLESGLSDTLRIEIVSNSEFSLVEAEGRSCKIDEFYNIHINSKRPFLEHEFVLCVCEAFFSSGSIERDGPFSHWALTNIMPYLVAGDINRTPPVNLDDATGEQTVIFFFGAVVGVKELAYAFSTGDDSILSLKFDSVMGAGEYERLCVLGYKRAPDAIREILRQNKELRDSTVRIAAFCGYTLEQGL